MGPASNTVSAHNHFKIGFGRYQWLEYIAAAGRAGVDDAGTEWASVDIPVQTPLTAGSLTIS
jgi:hypothetical protein